MDRIGGRYRPQKGRWWTAGVASIYLGFVGYCAIAILGVSLCRISTQEPSDGPPHVAKGDGGPSCTPVHDMPSEGQKEGTR